MIGSGPCCPGTVLRSPAMPWCLRLANGTARPGSQWPEATHPTCRNLVRMIMATARRTPTAMLRETVPAVARSRGSLAEYTANRRGDDRESGARQQPRDVAAGMRGRVSRVASRPVFTFRHTAIFCSALTNPPLRTTMPEKASKTPFFRPLLHRLRQAEHGPVLRCSL